MYQNAFLFNKIAICHNKTKNKFCKRVYVFLWKMKESLSLYFQRNVVEEWRREGRFIIHLMDWSLCFVSRWRISLKGKSASSQCTPTTSSHHFTKKSYIFPKYNLIPFRGLYFLEKSSPTSLKNHFFPYIHV